MRDEDAYRVLCLDPGTDTLGSALMNIDVRVGDMDVSYAATWHAARRFSSESDIAQTFGTRLARINEHRRVVTELLEMHRPHAVACEAPFIGRFAQSGMALSELFATIQLTIYDYSPNIGFLAVDNRAAKRAVGIKTNKVGKDDVRKAVLNLINLTTSNEVKLELLDEHSIDAVAVGCFAAELLRDEWLLLDRHRRKG